MDNVRYICNLNKKMYSVITNDIVSEEVVITEKQIEHIKERHPGHLEDILPYFSIAVLEPDYILKDNKNTGLILKSIEENGERFQIVLRLHTSSDKPNYKNSIISAWKVSKNRWNNYIFGT